GNGQPAESSAVHGDALEQAQQRAPAGNAASVGAAAARRAGARRTEPAMPTQLQLDFEGPPSHAGRVASATARSEPPDVQELPEDLLPAPVGRRRGGVSSRGQRYGIVFHHLMQQATSSDQELAQLAQRLGLGAETIAPM